ncbi:MAG: hypothetical protein WA817_17015 [Candidatus Acidiferrum sp.]
MEPTDIEKYASAMKEIKLRTEVISLFLSGQREARYVPTTVETIGLQFRKVFELIAFASLAANRIQYSLAHRDFARHWEAARLFRNLRRINPDFYPKPVVEERLDRPGVLHSLRKRQEDYLTENDLITSHGRCGELMHAGNPFGQPIDYAFYQQSFPLWLGKTVNLLNNHQVHLLGDLGFYLFHMKEQGHEEIRWYRFQPKP